MFKLILADIEKDHYGYWGYDNRSKLYCYDDILRFWLWNGKVIRWFREHLGYGPYFRTKVGYYTVTLESHGWRTSDPELFKIVFPEAMSWKVVEMTPLEKAINAYDRLLGASEGEARDAIYHELLAILATFDMAPGTLFSSVDTITVRELENKSPAVQMISIIADLARKGIMPPMLPDEADYKLRLVHGLIDMQRRAHD